MSKFLSDGGVECYGTAVLSDGVLQNVFWVAAAGVD